MPPEPKTLLEPPGPRGVPVFGVLPRIWRDPLAFFQQVAREQGPVARIGLGKFTLYLLSHPDPIQYVMQDNAANYWKGSGMEMVRPVMGDGLAISTGDLWRRQRRMIQPSFQRKRLADLVPTMQAAIDEVLDRWTPNRPFDVAKEAGALVQNLIWRALFGEEVGLGTGPLGDALVEVNKYINSIVWSLLPLPEWLPTPRKRRFRRAMALLDKTLLDLIARRRHAPAEDRPDLLSRLVNARDPESGEAMSDRQLRDELMTLFVAGHDTTAGAMSWTLALLAQNPDVRDRLHEEVDALSGSPTAEELPNLELTERVIKESMRLYPPGWLLVRTPYEDDTIGGFHVPKGAPLLISQYVVHRHPDLWKDPDRFDPDRFLPERSQDRPRYAYFPYGGGQRLCIGAEFARIAIQLFVSSACRRFVLDLAPGHRLVPQPLTTLRAKHGVLMTARRR